MKIVKGSDLIFISQINRDGSGAKKVPEKYVDFMKNDDFKLIRLSITYDTYIAANFNLFVVKIKRQPG